MVWNEASGGALKTELEESVCRVSPTIQVTGHPRGHPRDVLDKTVELEINNASHVLVILTKGVADKGSASLSQIRSAIGSKTTVSSAGGTLLFLYLKQTEQCPQGWSFEAKPPPPEDVRQALWNHEAMEYRPSAPAAVAYEHTSMVLELLRRMRVEAAPAAAPRAGGADDGESKVPAARRNAGAMQPGARLGGGMEAPLLGTSDRSRRRRADSSKRRVVLPVWRSTSL